MTRMHPLLRVALLACPRDFRRHCADELSADLDRTRTVPLPLLATCANIAWTGVRLHAENLWRDVSYGARVLAKAPVFVAVATLTIALAIGTNIAGFTILKGMLLDPLPYQNAGRLAFISGVVRKEDQTSIDYPDARDFAQRSRTFTGISVETYGQGALTGMGRPIELHGWCVGGDYFSVLGARAELGRLLSRDDLGLRRIVISDELWRSKFGASLSVLGRRVAIDNHAYTVIGVAPARLYNPGPGFMEKVDYWISVSPRIVESQRSYYEFWAIGRLRDGVSWSQAQADLSRVAAQLAREYPSSDAHRGVLVRPLFNALNAPMQSIVLMLYGAAMLVLFVAAGNIGNLLLARTAARERDLIVRSALGATRKRIAAQIAVETGLIGIAGLALAVVLAWLGMHAIGTLLAALTRASGEPGMILPGWEHVAISVPVVLYGVLLTLLFTIGTAMLPVYSHGGDYAAALNAAGRGTGIARRARLRAALAASEIVLAFVVLCVAGLLLQSFMRLERRPVGFRESNVYSVQLYFPTSPRYSGSSLERFYVHAIQRLQTLPGVAASGEALIAGLGGTSRTNYSIRRSVAGLRGAQDVEFNSVSPSFFETLDIPLLQGRNFREGDTSTSEPVAIVSEAFALQHFGNAPQAIDKNVSVGESSGPGFPLRRIVGVVANVRHSLSDPPSQEVYVPFSQVTFAGPIVVRTNGNDPHLARDIDGTISRIDPLLPEPQIVPLTQLRLFDDFTTRVAAAVFLSLAAVALLLALAGVYGVVAYGVERRTHEFGIRMSLGARKRRIAFEVIREAIALGIAGVTIGTILAALATRALTGFLYETSPLDAGTFVGAAIFLMGAVVLAAAVPAARAVRVQPATALRCE